MLATLRKFFQQEDFESNQKNSNNELELLCGIMVEAAAIDGNIDQNEILKIKISLVSVFNEKKEEVEKAVSSCLNQMNEPNSLHFFTSKLNKSFDNNKKIILLEVLWDIVLADKKIHDFESNFIRRLAGLLYISNIDCANTKRKVLIKHKLV